MKVLLINNFHYRKGGSESVYFNTANLLRENGHEVIFYSLRRDSNIECEQSPYFPKGIDMNKAGLWDKFVGLLHYFFNCSAAHNLDKLIKAEKPDVAHIHLFYNGLSPSILKTLKKNHIPIVHTAHDYRMVCPGYTFKDGQNRICEACGGHCYWNCFKRKCAKGSTMMSFVMAVEMYYRNFFHHPAKYIDHFIYVSNYSKGKHFQYDKLLAEKNCSVLYNFCNSDVAKCKQSNLDTFDSYYLYYGRLSFEKGLATLLKSFMNNPELELKVVGTGPESDYLKGLCSDCPNISFLGYQSGKTLYDLVQNAKFVCVPSECYENNPMTIVESYSLSTPVIGAAIGGIPEIVHCSETGFLFESGSVDSLSEVLEKTENLSKEDYVSMKLYAEAFAEDHFDRGRHYESLVSIYSGLIK